MRKLFVVALLAMFTTQSANAVFFFFFIPGSVVSKIGDSLTGVEGDQCVSATAKVGDVIKSPNGNSAIVKSLSGTSSQCRQPEYPVRAKLEFTYAFSSQAGIDVPDGYVQKPVTAVARFHGTLLRAGNATSQMELEVYARPRQGADIEAVADSLAAFAAKKVNEYVVTQRENLTINEMRAVRFEASGRNKNAVFGGRYTYVTSVIEGDSEILIVHTAAPSKDDFTAERTQLRALAFGVKGIHATANSQATPVVTTASPVETKTPASESVAAPVATAATKAAPTARSESSPVNRQTVGDRLRELERLFKEGILTKQEYDSKKGELLRAL